MIDLKKRIKSLDKWILDKNNKLKKETFDISDAYVCGIGFMNMMGFWPK